MSTRSGLRVLGRGSLGVATLLALAPLAAPAPVPCPSPTRLVAAAVPATGIPVVVDDTPATGPPSLSAAPATGAPACPAAAARIAGRDLRRPGTAAPSDTACPAPAPTPAHTVALRPSAPVATTPVTASATHPVVPEPVPPAGPRPTPEPEAVLPVPIPPPLVIAPAVVSVPESYAAEHAPTSVLALGLCSIVVASIALVLRLVRRWR